MMQIYSTALVALLAMPGAFSAPTTPPAAPEKGSFRAQVKHRLNEEGTLGQVVHDSGLDDVGFASYWLAPAVAGGQEVTMLIDTGSADLWVLGPNVSPDQQQGQQIYDPSKSGTAKQMDGESFNIGYGQGGNGVSGPVFDDTFAVGSASVEHMAIGSADTLSGLPPGIFRSGIMGLAFQSGNSVKPDQQKTFMETLQPQLDSPVYVCNFKMDGSGFIEFGKVDTSLFDGDLSTIKADNASKYPGSWSSEGVKYVSNGNELATFDIVFDTGGPGTSGPVDAVRAYHNQISDSKDENGDGSSFTVPCNSQMPDLEFHFSNGAVGSIPGQKMLQPDRGDGRCQTWFNKENSADRGLVGDAFFNSNVVVFNQQDATIAWARQK